MPTAVPTPNKDIRPPGPSRPNGYKVSATIGNVDDSAHYILKPDVDFYRPWIATPGGSAFIWPLGIEGFSLASNAEVGIHKYIGDNDIDIDVIYPDEWHITLTGTFPGRLGMDNARALRDTILEPTSEAGKILALPLVAEHLLYVTVLNHRVDRDSEDRTGGVAYSIECVKVGTGRKLNLKKLKQPHKNPTAKRKNKGKSSRRTKVKHKRSTTKKIAHKTYRSAEYQQRIITLNADRIEEAGMPLFKAGYASLPQGLDLDI